MADGSRLPVLGEAELPLCFGQRQIKHMVVVANIESDGLLGIDFMKRHGCELNYGRGTFSVNGEAFTFREELGCHTTCRVTAAKTVVVPPRSEFVVEGKVSKRGGMSAHALVEPICSFQDKHRLLIGKVLVDTSKISVPLRVMNPFEEPVVIHKDTNMAVVHPVVEVSSFHGEGNVTQVNQVSSAHANAADESPMMVDVDKESYIGPLPQHLQELVDRSVTSLNPSEKLRVRNLIWSYHSVFSSGPSDLGRTGIIKHRIDTQGEKPVKLPPRKIPIHLQDAVNREIDRLLDLKVIRPSSSPWSSCVVVVRKANGEIRLCLDVRAVNARSKHDSYPLPRVDTCLESMNGSKYYSTLDLANGFLQIEVEPEDRCKTAFSVMGKGFYEFETLPFGLQGGPSTCQRLLEQVMSGLQWVSVIIYMDDLTCFAKTFESAYQGLQQVLQRLKDASLKVKTSKCILFQTSVSFLGHKVSATGISTDPEKIDKVRDWPVPTNLTEVKSFLGLCSYYKSFIDHYGDVARPLNELSRKDRDFIWSKECQQAFEILKDKLISAPILAYPDQDERFILDTDASAHAISGVLSQVQNGQERVIAYGSKTLSKTEQNYCTTRRELLAIVYFCQYYRHFLLARKFLLRTDHGALTWLFRWRSPEGQVARWLEILGPFDFEIKHRQGAKHGNADALSRIPCKQCGMGADLEGMEYVEDMKSRAREMLAKHQSSAKSSDMKVKAIRTLQRALDECSGPVLEPCGTPSSTSILERDPPRQPRKIVNQVLTDGSSSDEDIQVMNTRPDVEWWRGFTKSDLSKMQAEDPNIAFIAKRLKAGDSKPKWEEISAENAAIKKLWGDWDRLCICDNVVYRLFESETQAGGVWQLILPKPLVVHVMKLVHDTTGCHLGVDKTLGALRSRVYWYGYKGFATEWVKNCHVCNSRKPNPSKKWAPLKQFPVGTTMERVALDIMGRLPATDRKNQYILVVGCQFTKFIESYALPDITAATVATVLVTQFFSRYGVCRILHSDQGSNFTSELFRQVCTLLGIEKSRTSSYHPQCDGFIEVFNKTLQNMLSTLVSDNQRDWDLKLPYAMMAYRSTPHKSTGFTPNFLMFGRETLLPLDLIIGRPPEKEHRQELPFVSGLRSVIEEAHYLAFKHTKKAAVRQKKNYDIKVKNRPFQKGSRVWVHFPHRTVKQTAKFKRQWKGPYIIRKKVGDVNYKVQLNAKTEPKVLHRDRLFPYSGPNPKPTPFPSCSVKVSFPEPETEFRSVHDKRRISDIHPSSSSDNSLSDISEAEQEAEEAATSRPRRMKRAPKRLGHWVQ